MNRNLIYLLIFIVLGIGVYFFVIKKSTGTLNEKEKSFAVEDTASIGKIFIADMQGKKVVLERNKSGWVVNNKFPARQDYMNSLLSTVRRVSAGYPVPEAAQKTVITNMASENKKVEIYNKEGALLKSYLVGSPTLESNGTYMLMTGSKTPFVTDIPGFVGVLNTRYVTDEEEIRSRSIFNFRMNEISAVTVNYNLNPDSSFTISVLGPDSFEVKSGNNSVLTNKNMNKQRVAEYLKYYEFVNSEAYQNNLAKKDTILQTDPYCTITVTDRQQQPHSIVIYYMPVNTTSEQFDRKGNVLKHDVDHYFATINNGNDFVIIQQFHFGRLFRSFDYFMASPKTMKKT